MIFSTKGFPKAVVHLSIASLLTDIAGDAIYPLLPLYLAQVFGANAMFIGALEGVAESVASITKYLSGYYSDRIGKREPFVIVGYSIAALSRPLMGIIATPWQAFIVRFTDRFGKGIRGAPRDAWLATLATAETRGKVFGFHRSMDHLGAMLGPLLASAFLWFYPGQYRTLFLLTIFPGLLTLWFVFAAARAPKTHEQEVQVAPKVTSLKNIGALPTSFKKYLFVLGVFTLGSSSDAFLLLKLKDSGFQDAWIPLFWAALHFVKASTSHWGGHVSDWLGRRQTITMGWVLYALIYLLFGLTHSPWAVGLLFLSYGLFFALTESPEKALVADLVPAIQLGTAYGLYNLVIGIGALPASLIFGYIWEHFSPLWAFSMGAAFSALASTLLWVLPILNRRPASILAP